VAGGLAVVCLGIVSPTLRSPRPGDMRTRLARSAQLTVAISPGAAIALTDEAVVASRLPSDPPSAALADAAAAVALAVALPGVFGVAAPAQARLFWLDEASISIPAAMLRAAEAMA
jgi:hypothetical protein